MVELLTARLKVVPLSRWRLRPLKLRVDPPSAEALLDWVICNPRREPVRLPVVLPTVLVVAPTVLPTAPVVVPATFPTVEVVVSATPPTVLPTPPSSPPLLPRCPLVPDELDRALEDAIVSDSSRSLLVRARVCVRVI